MAKSIQQLIKEFEHFHTHNPHVYELFERFGDEAARAGRHRFGAKMIVERMRWYSKFEVSADQEYKICNNHTAFFARLWIMRRPQHRDLFVLKTSAADSWPPYAQWVQRQREQEELETTP